MHEPNVEGPGGFLERMSATQFRKWAAWRKTMNALREESTG